MAEVVLHHHTLHGGWGVRKFVGSDGARMVEVKWEAEPRKGSGVTTSYLRAPSGEAMVIVHLDGIESKLHLPRG